MYFDCPALLSEYPMSGLIKYNVNGEFENAVEPPVCNAPLLHVSSIPCGTAMVVVVVMVALLGRGPQSPHFSQQPHTAPNIFDPDGWPLGVYRCAVSLADDWYATMSLPKPLLLFKLCIMLHPHADGIGTQGSLAILSLLQS
jgi:hypothetical protein